MKNIFLYKFNNFLTDIYIAEDKDKITNIFFNKPQNLNCFNFKETSILKQANLQLIKYFNKELKIFDLPLNPQVSQISKLVLTQLTKIPYGKTKSYLDVAMMIKKPTYSRAIGMICSKNPIPILIPCHRVIKSNGVIGGFMGTTLKEKTNIKKFLLDMEK
jgi:methylated-DNA-[protein]-cysteine S-methyltransferase